MPRENLYAVLIFIFKGMEYVKKVKKKEILKIKANNLPELPGIYIMKDKNLNIIYVGKAKNLKNRVSQYFRYSSNHTEKVLSMVENIEDFEYIVTDTEYEALVLECNLIKKYCPKYNILLKDDKGYHYIKIINETWPRLTIANKRQLNDKHEYIGPFMSLFKVRATLDEVIKIFKLPTCKRNFNKISRPCLNYYINQCSAPCAGKITHEEYINDVKNACLFIKNGGKEELKKMKKEMVEASDALQFEKAAKIRDRIKIIESSENKQKIILNTLINCDFIAFVNNKDQISMNVLKFKQGVLYKSENFIVNLSYNPNEDMLDLIKSYYIMKDILPDKVFISEKIDNLDIFQAWLSKENNKNIKIELPKSGLNLEIMQMCKKNSYECLVRTEQNKNFKMEILLGLKNILKLEKMPQYIEAYDISNIQDAQKVGGLVVFKNGKPLRSAYKKFNIKLVPGQDDYASMLEILQRRFKRYFSENNNNSFKIKPDLILIDGGIGHTRKIKEYLQSVNLNDIPVFGMVKDSKHKTRAITNGISEIDIKNSDTVFNFITKIQDEVHRYTICFHRQKREKELRTSELEKIPNIGKKRSKILLKRFKSIDRLSKASLEELETIPGLTLQAVYSIIEYFKNPIKDENV